jgi:hypothetical protein
MTRLVLSSMKNSTYSVCSLIVSTVKKSQATIAAACARRNCVQVGPERLGAGPKPCRRSNVLIVVALTRMPSLRNSPVILTQPQRGFSLAIRRMNATTSWVDRRAAGLAPVPVGPLSSYQLAMPAQQRLGRDKERCPPIPGDGSAGCCEQDPVKRRESGAAGLAAQHPQLLPEHQELQVLSAITRALEDQQAGERSDDQPDQEQPRLMVRSRCSQHESGFPRPTGLKSSCRRVCPPPARSANYRIGTADRIG